MVGFSLFVFFSCLFNSFIPLSLPAIVYFLWPQWQDKQLLDHQPQSVNCSVIKHRDDIIMRWNISRAKRYLPRPTFLSLLPGPLFCIFIVGVISLTCTQGDQGDNLKSSSVPVFIWAAAWGWVLGCRAGKLGLNWVCAYMIYVAYTEGGDRDDLPWSHSQSSLPTC